jgi:hypothetical protein
MKKLKLDVNQLHVAAFHVLPADHNKAGTVIGNDEVAVAASTPYNWCPNIPETRDDC